MVVSIIQLPWGSRFTPSAELNSSKTAPGVLMVLQSLPFPSWGLLLFTDSSLCPHPSAGCCRRGQISQHQSNVTFLPWSGSLQVPFDHELEEQRQEWTSRAILKWKAIPEPVWQCAFAYTAVRFYSLISTLFKHKTPRHPTKEELEEACRPPAESCSWFQWRRGLEKFTTTALSGAGKRGCLPLVLWGNFNIARV